MSVAFRPSWDDYFLKLVGTVSTRSTCDRGRSGTVVVRDRQQLVTGYVGSPPGEPHCDDVGHDMIAVSKDNEHTTHCVRTIHAEQNAIVQAARIGTALAGSTFYTTMVPCSTCAMLIVGVGALRVVSLHSYSGGTAGLNLLARAGITTYVIDDKPPVFPTPR